MNEQQEDVERWGREQARAAAPWTDERWRRVCAILGQRVPAENGCLHNPCSIVHDVVMSDGEQERQDSEENHRWAELMATEQEQQDHSQEYMSLIYEVLGEKEVERRRALAKEHALWDRKMGVLSGDCPACEASASMHPLGANGWHMCLVCSYGEHPDMPWERQVDEDMRRQMKKD